MSAGHSGIGESSEEGVPLKGIGLIEGGGVYCAYGRGLNKEGTRL